MVIDNNERSNRGGGAADFEKIKQQTAERAWPIDPFGDSCFPPSITTNQAAITARFRVMNRYVGNLPPMTKQSRSEACGAFAARDIQ